MRNGSSDNRIGGNCVICECKDPPGSNLKISWVDCDLC